MDDEPLLTNPVGKVRRRFGSRWGCVSAQPNMRFQWHLSNHDWSDRFALHRREAGGGADGLLSLSINIGDENIPLMDQEA
jgi:hypothetical protein